MNHFFMAEYLANRFNLDKDTVSAAMTDAYRAYNRRLVAQEPDGARRYVPITEAGRWFEAVTQGWALEDLKGNGNRFVAEELLAKLAK